MLFNVMGGKEIDDWGSLKGCVCFGLVFILICCALVNSFQSFSIVWS